MPVETITLESGDEGIAQGCARVIELCHDFNVMEIIVGLPKSLNDTHTLSTARAIEFARSLSAKQSIPIRMIDERLTTVTAHAQLRSTGKNQKQTRSVIDQVAAVSILQQALDIERSSLKLPGWTLADLPES